MIEIFVLGTHATDVEGKPGPQRIEGRIEVVVHCYRDKGRHVKILESLAIACLLETLLDRVTQHAVLVGVHPHRKDPIRYLACAAQAGRGDRCRIDRNVSRRSEDRLQRLAQPGSALTLVRHLVHLPVEFNRALALKDLAHDLDVLLRARDGLAVGHTVPTLHHLRAGGTEAHNKAPPGELIEGHGGHRTHGGGASGHLHDGGADPDLAGLRQYPGGRRDRVVAVGLGGPDGVVAHRLCLLDQIDWNVDVFARVTKKKTEFHNAGLPTPKRGATY